MLLVVLIVYESSFDSLGTTAFWRQLSMGIEGFAVASWATKISKRQEKKMLKDFIMCILVAIGKDVVVFCLKDRVLLYGRRACERYTGNTCVL